MRPLRLHASVDSSLAAGVSRFHGKALASAMPLGVRTFFGEGHECAAQYTGRIWRRRGPALATPQRRPGRRLRRRHAARRRCRHWPVLLAVHTAPAGIRTAQGGYPAVAPGAPAATGSRSGTCRAAARRCTFRGRPQSRCARGARSGRARSRGRQSPDGAHRPRPCRSSGTCRRTVTMT